jgi:hypothetical protein
LSGAVLDTVHNPRLVAARLDKTRRALKNCFPGREQSFPVLIDAASETFLCREAVGRTQMIDTVVIQPEVAIGEPSIAGVSWPAVTAGAIVSCALTFLLLAFGVGLGLSVVSPWAGSGVSATTFKIGTGLYLIVIAMLSSSIGGYLAGRLRTRWVGVHSDEVYFRDTAHGFIAWALASVLGAVLLASPAGSLISGTASGATQGAAVAASRSGPMDGYIDTLLRPDNPTSQAAGNGNETRGEMLRLFTSSFRNGGELKPADRDYVAKVVAARTGRCRQARQRGGHPGQG